MLEKLHILLLLMAVMGTLAVVADRFRLPFPILLVLAGLAIAIAPGLPDVTLDPEMVLFVFLPPLVFSAAFNFPWDDFRSNLLPIFALAVGLVFATMIGVAYAAHWLIPGLTLATGFVLGAIVSPPDTLAAGAVMKNLRVPRRLSTLLEGESLVNDASGLVAYQFAVAAVVTGSFSMAEASRDFVWDALGGVFLGWGMGHLMSLLQRGLRDPAVQITLSLLMPYFIYFVADKLSCSGILALVAAGLHVGHRSWETMSSEARLQNATVWRFIEYFLNGLIFILIGLQFPTIMAGLDHIPLYQLLLIGLIISIVVIAIRFAWIIPLAIFQKFVPRANLTGRLSRNEFIVASWSGMRGVVSLAAALAIPQLTASGEEFPFRHLILFLTFSVIFFTLVVQGLSLPPLVRKLKVEESNNDFQKEANVRMKLVRGLIKEIDDLMGTDLSESEKAALGTWRKYYELREEHIQQRLETLPENERLVLTFELDLLPRLLQHVREHLNDLRRVGQISEETRRRIQIDFDIEERRLIQLLELYDSGQVR